MATIPRRLFRIFDEAQEVMAQEPSAHVEFTARGSWSKNAEGDWEIGADVSAPGAVTGGADVGIRGGYSRHYTHVGVGEVVIRIVRPGRTTSAATGGEEPGELVEPASPEPGP